MSVEFWIGEVIQIFISIGMAFAIAPIRRWYARRGESKQQAKHERITAEYAQTLRSLRRPEILNQFYLRRLPSMLQSSLIFVSAMILLVLITQNDFTKLAHDPDSRHWYLFLKVALDLDIFAASYALSWFMRLLVGSELVALRVNRFHEYVKTVPSDIRRVEAEEEAWKEWTRH